MFKKEKKIIIKTQKELNKLVRVEKDEEAYIEGEGLRLNSCIEVFGFIKVRVNVDMDYSRKIVLRGSSRAVLRGSSRAELWESSRAELWGSSSAVLWESSRAVLWGSSSAVLRESSSAELWESSRAVLWESSSAVLRGSSISWVYSADVEINLFGFSICYQLFEGKGKITKKRKTTNIIKPIYRDDFAGYEDRYPVKVKKGKAIMYKAVHKNDIGYFSDYNKSFFYEIGKEYTEKCAPKESGSCSAGLHIAHKSWARSFGIGWGDMAILECEVDVKDIIVSSDTDGKVRTSKLKILRELPKDEWYA